MLHGSFSELRQFNGESLHFGEGTGAGAIAVVDVAVGPFAMLHRFSPIFRRMYPSSPKLEPQALSQTPYHQTSLTLRVLALVSGSLLVCRHFEGLLSICSKSSTSKYIFAERYGLCVLLAA